MPSHQQNVATGGEMGKQAAFLNHVTNPLPETIEPVCDGYAIEFDRSGVGFDESTDEAQ